MQSRMDKYRGNHENEEARSNKNKNLYSEIYNSDFYTEIAELENTNEVDLSKIKELLKNREEYQKAKNYRDILGGKDEEITLRKPAPDEPEKIYDVNSILERAKEERRETENYKKGTTEYDILKKLNLLSIEEKANDMLQNNKREEEKLRELIDTITMKKEEILESEQGLDFLDELRGDTMVLNGNRTYLKGDTTIIEDEILSTKETLIGEMVVANPRKEIKKEPIRTEKVTTTPRPDNTFFTTSLGLSKDDFEDFKDFKEYGKKSTGSIVFQIILFVVTTVLLVVGFYVFNTYINV